MHNINTQRTADKNAGPLYASLAAADLGVLPPRSLTGQDIGISIFCLFFDLYMISKNLFMTYELR